MKRIVIILSVIFLMIDSVAVKAQNEITELFNRIKAAEGVRSSVTEFRNEKNGIKAETKIFDLIVGQQQWGFFDLIKDAFEKEKNGCYFDWYCYEPIAGNSNRVVWGIQSGLENDILVGNENNSSFAIMGFNDPANSRCRTVCAAEWWKLKDPNYRQARLIYSYGEKPKQQLRTERTVRYSLPNGVNADSLMNRYRTEIDSLINVQGKLSWESMDSIMNKYGAYTIEKIREGDDDGFVDMDRYFGHLKPIGDDSGNIDMIQYYGKMNSLGADSGKGNVLSDQDYKEWVLNATQRMSKLNPSEWLRLFGLMTEQLIDNQGDNKQLIVSASLVLDLCKNIPSKLDEDERGICARRLGKIIRSMREDKKNEYVTSLLLLAADKLSD